MPSVEIWACLGLARAFKIDVVQTASFGARRVLEELATKRGAVIIAAISLCARLAGRLDSNYAGDYDSGRSIR